MKKSLWMALLGAWAFAECLEAVASRLMTRRYDGATVTVVVPGFRNSDPHHPNAVNRWRARTAYRTAQRCGTQARILACGGDPAGSGIPEADLLTCELRRLGFPGTIVVERASRSTFENALYAAPLLADAERIAIASNPLHGLKLRIYLTCEDKLLRHRFIPSQDFQLGEWGLLRMLTAIVGTFDLLRVLSREFTKRRRLDGNS